MNARLKEDLFIAFLVVMVMCAAAVLAWQLATWFTQ
jgi:hypothetical protein